MNRLVAAALFFVTIDASAQCTPALNEARVDVVSQGLWRGINLGGRIFAEPRVDVGLCGRPATTIGTRGTDLTVEAWVPVQYGNGTDLESVRARHLWYFGEDKDHNWIGASVRESHWGNGGPHVWTTELALEARKRIAIESEGFRADAFAEVARDLNRFKATYARVGIEHEIGGVSIPFQGEVELYTSASDYSGSFGWHDAQISVWALRRLGSGSARIAIGGGYDRVAHDIGRSRAWAGVGFRLHHS